MKRLLKTQYSRGEVGDAGVNQTRLVIPLMKSSRDAKPSHRFLFMTGAYPHSPGPQLLHCGNYRKCYRARWKQEVRTVHVCVCA